MSDGREERGERNQGRDLEEAGCELTGNWRLNG